MSLGHTSRCQVKILSRICSFSRTVFLRVVLLCGCVFMSSCSTQPIDIDARISPGRLLDDRLLEKAIRQEITSTLSNSESTGAVRAIVFNGVAHLVGTVNQETQKQSILAVVEDFRHIDGIYDEINIQKDFSPLINITDRRIEGQANVRLSRNDSTKNEQLRVVVHKGELYLIGIATRRVGEVAIESVKHIRGVQQVIVLLEYLD